MKKKIAILGSTGSIGTSTLSIIKNKKKLFIVNVLKKKNKYFLIQHLKEKEIGLNCAILYQINQQKSSAIIEEKIISLFQRLLKS